jgi:phosphopantothenoylcysteine decarboxylase/phosphopantothenate--cysteine ligase
MESLFRDKRVLVGVTGGIAAYKSAELVRMLVKAGAQVQVVMTPSATEFITPLTLETLSGNPALTRIFDLRKDSSIEHTDLGRDMDAAVIAPVTADFLGRLAGGLADQLLLCVLMASHMPVLLCPSMNTEMWNNPLVQRNVGILNGIERYRWMEPAEGELACKVIGKGRMPEPAQIMRHLARVLSPQDLAGQKVVVTAGPTREWLDPVRYLSNPSTGKMGFAVAEAAWQRGAAVTLISGPTALELPAEFENIAIESTQDLLDAVSQAMNTADVLVMAAAPADYTPTQKHEQKIKKSKGPAQLELARTPDVLGEIAHIANGTFLVGFAAETGDLKALGSKKAKDKGVHLLFANQVGEAATGSGFAGNTNSGLLIGRDGQVIQEIPTLSKLQVAHQILNQVAQRLS